MVAALGRVTLIGSAETGSETERVALEALSWGRRVLVLDPATGERLGQHGAETIQPSQVVERISEIAGQDQVRHDGVPHVR